MTTLITDHVAQALANLLPEWRFDDRAREFVTAFVEEIQEIEAVLYQLVVERYLSTAVGVQLDAYGDLLNVERETLDDEQYRAVLRAKPLINRAPGTPDSVARAAEILFFAADGVRYDQNQPASYSLTLASALTGTEIHTQANAASIANEANATTGFNAIDATLASSDADPYLGTYAIHATAPGTGTSIVQYAFTSVANTVYRITFAARRLGTSLDQRIEGWVGVEESPLEFVDTSVWDTYGFYVRATGASVTIEWIATIGAGETGEFLALDALSVRPVIELSDELIAQAERLLLEATPNGVGINAIVDAPIDTPFRFDVGPGYDLGRLGSLIGT